MVGKWVVGKWGTDGTFSGIVWAVARLARVVVAEVSHHVTQRGNARRFLLASDAERFAYLDLLREAARVEDLSVVGYCAMSNHVHLVLIPHRAEALALALKSTHGRYASYWNASHGLSGHAWQGRFYSCPLDEGHGWQALRYTELNPVRAGLAAEAAAWRWSSAAAHCGLAEADACLDMEPWRHRWSEETWQRFLKAGEAESELRALRRCTHTGRPLGGAEFIRKLEPETRRCVTPRQGGRPQKALWTSRRRSASPSSYHRVASRCEGKPVKRPVCPLV